MAGKPRIPGRKETRGGERGGAGRPKGMVDSTPRKKRGSPKADMLPTEEMRKRWRAAARKFKSEFGNTPEYYILRLITDSEIFPTAQLSIFKEYLAAFNDPIGPKVVAGATINNYQQNKYPGSPELLEEHPGAVVGLPRLKSDMESADVIDIKSKGSDKTGVKKRK